MVMRSPERGQIWENIAAALNSLQKPNFILNASQELFEIVIHFYWLQKKNNKKTKAARRIIQVVKNNTFSIVD